MSDYVAGILKAKRKQLKLSVKYVIEQLHQYDLNISDKTLYSWESGHRQPDADSFLALCDIYGITSFKEIEKSPAPAEADTGDKRLDGIIENYHQLNEDGQQQLAEQAEGLTYIPKYKKCDSVPEEEAEVG